MKTTLRAVPDTNVILASQSTSPNSPNHEFLTRWQQGEFDLLYTDDTLREYIEKLVVRNAPRETITNLIVGINKLGVNIQIHFFHLAKFPSDPDDIPFLLCADNGNATHLISYDIHLLELQGLYAFKICKTLDFLLDLRQILSESQASDESEREEKG